MTDAESRELERLCRFSRIVEGFITQRAGYINAIENCAPDNTTDYWRWQGHAEARRQLISMLPWPPDTDDAERISREARVIR
jgi:hypothetical protein